MYRYIDTALISNIFYCHAIKIKYLITYSLTTTIWCQIQINRKRSLFFLFFFYTFHAVSKVRLLHRQNCWMVLGSASVVDIDAEHLIVLMVYGFSLIFIVEKAHYSQTIQLHKVIGLERKLVAYIVLLLVLCREVWELYTIFFFYAPEGTSGGILKSHRPSVRPSVRLSVTNRVSAISHKLLKQIWWNFTEK